MVKKFKQTTLADIARRLNLSKVSVSKALRDHPDIAEQTKLRVKQVAAEMGYTPNFYARNLSSNKSNTIGLVVPKIAHSFFAEVIEAIYDVANENEYDVILTVSREDEQLEQHNIYRLLSMRVDGLLISVSQHIEDISIFNTIKSKNVPLVFFDRMIEGLTFSSVTVNDRKGAYDATEFAIKAGYSRIAHFAGYGNTNIGSERLNGYLDALHAYRIPVRSEWIIEGGYDEVHGYQGLMALADSADMPEIIFAASYPVALGIYDAAAKLRLRIPDDIDVICFGDSPVNKYIKPALTCVDQPVRELGTKAMELLIEEIERPDSRGGKHIVLDAPIKIRETCRPKPDASA
ncbi:LacI family DNA-binding transcriptional regulator [candidate division KSB1 bacterium]|nr:LacI family DNA-binding transcriptional regulator [candidate division KSB1 bacterium]